MKLDRDGERVHASKPAQSGEKSRSAQPPAGRADAIRALHELGGNQAVGTLIEREGSEFEGARSVRKSAENGPGEVAAVSVQPSLDVTPQSDPAEREAERVADTVVHGKPSDEPAVTETVEGIGRSPVSTTTATESQAPTGVEHIASDRLSGLNGGRRLPETVRSEFEGSFGHSFEDVRIHTGSRADEAARSIGATAFTVGTDVAFADGTYRPETREGKHLLAHELTHVVQQRGGQARVQRYMGENPFAEEPDRPSRQEMAEYYTAPPGAMLPEEGKDMLEGVGEGIIAFPKSIYYAAYRWFDSVNVFDSQRVVEIQLERERVARLFGHLTTAARRGVEVGGPIYTFARFLIRPLVQEVIDEMLTDEEVEQLTAWVEDVMESEEAEQFEEQLRDRTGEGVRRFIGKQVGDKLITKLFIKKAAQYIFTTKAVSEFTTKVATRVGVGWMFLPITMYGTLQEASLASQRLRERYPTAYTELRARDLDLMYFLVEDHLENLKQLILEHIRETILDAVDEHLPSADDIEYRQLPGATIYLIEPGDTLTAIAEEFGVSVSMLQETNDVDPRNLQVGEPLLIPEPEPLIIY